MKIIYKTKDNKEFDNELDATRHDMNKPYFRVTISTTVEIPHEEGFLDDGKLNLNHLMYLGQKKFEEKKSYELSYLSDYVIPSDSPEKPSEIIPLTQRFQQKGVTLKESVENKDKIKK